MTLADIDNALAQWESRLTSAAHNLFDLQNDPGETKDLAADPAHAAEVDRLLRLLKDWKKEVGDKQPLRSDKPQPLAFDFSKVGPAK